MNGVAMTVFKGISSMYHPNYSCPAVTSLTIVHKKVRNHFSTSLEAKYGIQHFQHRLMSVLDRTYVRVPVTGTLS